MVPTGGGTHDLAIAPDGKNAYVVTVLNHTVSQYRINAATGALSRKPALRAGTVLAPELIALAPDGKNAYVTGDIGNLSQYAISPATGKITPLSPATVATPPGGSIGLAVASRGPSLTAVPAEAAAPLVHRFRHGVLAGLSEIPRRPGRRRCCWCCSCPTKRSSSAMRQVPNW